MQPTRPKFLEERGILSILESYLNMLFVDVRRCCGAMCVLLVTWAGIHRRDLAKSATLRSQRRKILIHKRGLAKSATLPPGR